MATSFNNLFESYSKCIPFFQYTAEQHLTNFEVVFEQRCYWYAPSNQLLPFQISRMKRPTTDWNLKLKRKDGSTDDITSLLEEGQIMAYTGYGKDIIQYLATQELVLDCGHYYYIFTDGVETWYSEWFEVLEEEIYIDKEMEITGDTWVNVGEPNQFVEPNSNSGGITAQYTP